MRLLVRFLLIAASFFCLGLACPTVEPPPPPRLPVPTIDSFNLTGYDKLRNEHREALKISWSPPHSEQSSAHEYTIIRKTQKDSLFDVFDFSQEIPGDTLEFFDDLTLIGFPKTSYDTVSYRIFAVDSLGRRGDTTEPVSIILSAQPSFEEFDQEDWSLSWSVLGILGAISSRIEICNQDRTKIWTSPFREEFGEENQTIFFSAALPDSLRPLESGTWYYGLYVEANGAERQSLKVGSFNVK
ncbi:MAG: hypothetical protein ACLFVE_11200 [Chitinispirillaceae bacterium]